MDFLNSLFPLLRLTHILFGIVWVGFGAFTAFVLHPAAERAGESGQEMLRTFYAYSLNNAIMPIAAVVTTVVGLLMWGIRADGMNLAGYTTTGSIVMAIGVVFGLLAFGHGAGATARYSNAFADAAKAYQGASEVTMDTLNEAQKKLYLHANISAVLAIVSTVCMAGARYI